MATTNKRLCAGTLTDSSATIYTAPASSGNYAILKSLILCNKTASVAKATILLDDVEIVAARAIYPFDTICIPVIDQIVQEGETIKGFSDTASAINYYLSGKEVT